MANRIYTAVYDTNSVDFYYTEWAVSAEQLDGVATDWANERTNDGLMGTSTSARSCTLFFVRVYFMQRTNSVYIRWVDTTRPSMGALCRILRFDEFSTE